MPGLLASDTFNRTQPIAEPQAQDSFARPDNLSSMGVTNGSGPLDPRTWSARDGTWGIISNTAYARVLGATAAGAIATVDLGSAEVAFSVEIRATGAGALHGVIFRYLNNSNYWMARGGNTTHITIEKVVNGVRSTVFTSPTLNFSGTLRVLCVGPSISVYLTGAAGNSGLWDNVYGATVGSIVDSFNQSATQFGICSNNVNDRFGNAIALGRAALPLGPDGASLGSTDGTGILDPAPWYQWPFGYGWGIVANQAATPTPSSVTDSWHPQTCIATINAQRSDVTVQVTVAATLNQCALVFRFIDLRNYWYWFKWSTSPQVWVVKVVNGVQTIVLTSTTTPAITYTVGDTIRVACVGPVLVGYRNNVQTWTLTDSANQYGTHFGLYTSQEFPSSQPGGDSSVRFDNFALDPPGGSGWYVGISAFTSALAPPIVGPTPQDASGIMAFRGSRYGVIFDSATSGNTDPANPPGNVMYLYKIVDDATSPTGYSVQVLYSTETHGWQRFIWTGSAWQPLCDFVFALNDTTIVLAERSDVTKPYAIRLVQRTGETLSITGSLEAVADIEGTQNTGNQQYLVRLDDSTFARAYGDAGAAFAGDNACFYEGIQVVGASTVLLSRTYIDNTNYPNIHPGHYVWIIQYDGARLLGWRGQALGGADNSDRFFAIPFTAAGGPSGPAVQGSSGTSPNLDRGGIDGTNQMKWASSGDQRARGAQFAAGAWSFVGPDDSAFPYNSFLSVVPPNRGNYHLAAEVRREANTKATIEWATVAEAGGAFALTAQGQTGIKTENYTPSSDYTHLVILGSTRHTDNLTALYIQPSDLATNPKTQFLAAFSF